MLQTSKSSSLGREVADIEVNCFLLRCLIRNILFIPPSFSDHTVPKSYTMKVFMIILHALAWKDNAIVHISQTIAWGGGCNLTSKWLLDLLWSCSSIHHKIIPDFQCLSFSGTNSALLLSCQASYSLYVHSPLSN